MNYRDKNLLKMARGKNCLLLANEGCQYHDTSTTVAAHSNQQKHGKGMGIKAHDYYTVWACANCHTWLDQGKAPKAEKIRAFDAAHKRQVAAWQSFVDTGTGIGWELMAVAHALLKLKI